MKNNRKQTNKILRTKKDFIAPTVLSALPLMCSQSNFYFLTFHVLYPKVCVFGQGWKGSGLVSLLMFQGHSHNRSWESEQSPLESNAQPASWPKSPLGVPSSHLHRVPPDFQMSRWACSTSPPRGERWRNCSSDMAHSSLPPSSWKALPTGGSRYWCSVHRSHF